MEKRGITLTGVGIAIFAVLLAGAAGGTVFLYLRTSGLERDYRTSRTDHQSIVDMISEMNRNPQQAGGHSIAPEGFDLRQAVSAAATAAGLSPDQLQRTESQPDRTLQNGWIQHTLLVHLGGTETNPLPRRNVERLIERVETEHRHVVTLDVQIQLIADQAQRNTRITFATFSPPVEQPPE